MTNNELQHSELQRSERLAPYVASYRDADPLIPLIEVEQLVAHRTALHDPSTHTSWKKKIMFTVTSASLLTFAFLTVFNSGGDNASPVATQRSTSQTHEGQSRASSTTIANEPTAQSLRDDRTGAVSPTAAEDTDTSPDSIFAYYTLTENEQKRIGLLDEGSAVTFFYTKSDKNVRCLGILRSWGALTRKRTLPDDVVAIDAQPKFVTDGLGRKRMMSYENRGDSVESERRLREINSLIPILVREDPSSASMGERDLLFWYLPTKEFVALLPDHIGSRVNDHANNVQADVRQNHASTRSANIYPNPSKGELYLKLDHSGSKKAKVVLRNLQGMAMSAERMIDIDSRSDVRLDYDVPDGVYLLDILPDHGERVVLRVIIVK